MKVYKLIPTSMQCECECSSLFFYFLTNATQTYCNNSLWQTEKITGCVADNVTFFKTFRGTAKNVQADYQPRSPQDKTAQITV